jgi:hypothetical protein
MNKKIIIFVSFLFLIALFALISKSVLVGNSEKQKNINTDSIEETTPQNSSEFKKNEEQIADNEVKQDFENFVKTAPSSDIEWANFVKNGLSIDKFSDSVGIKINPQIKKLIEPNNFDLFACPSWDENGNDLGLVMNLKIMEDYEGDLYKDEVNLMKEWESTIFQDVTKLLFSNRELTKEQLEQKLSFKGGEFARGQRRYAEVFLPNDSLDQISYSIMEDYIIIVNSEDCLRKAEKKLYDVEN